MHKNLTFLLVANQNDLVTKIGWAQKLIESYQNSSVIVLLITSKEVNLNFVKSKQIKITHYPSNRKIDVHLLLIKLAKLIEATYLCYVSDRFMTNIPVLTSAVLNSYGVIRYNEKVIGFSVSCNGLLEMIKNDVHAVNLVRQDMLASGLMQ